MRGIPYLINFSDLGNEAHLRPWPKTYVLNFDYIYVIYCITPSVQTDITV